MREIQNIKTGAWCALMPPFEDEKHISELAECGIDFIFEDINESEETQRTLHLCEKYGIGILIRDEIADDDPDEKRFAEIAAKNGYLDSPSFIGHSLSDEPTAGSFEDLAERVAVCKKVFPGKTPYINLLPGYAPLEVYGTPSYREYIRAFADIVKTDYISVDIYPFNEFEGVKGTYENYLENIAAVGTVCREHGLDFYGFIQSMGFNHVMREPDEWEMRWQCYCYLAFGCSRILHFCYMTPPSGAEYFERAMIGKSGEKTPLWYYGKAVNAELHALSPMLAGYENPGAFIISGKKEQGKLRFADPVPQDSLKGVCGFDTDEDVLIGVYRKGEQFAFTALNISDPAKRINTVLSFETDKAIRVFRKDGIKEYPAGENRIDLGAAVVFIG